MFGLGQAPALAAGAEHAGHGLRQLLLVALQGHQQTPLLVDALRAGQVLQAGFDLLIALLQAFVDLLREARLLGLAALFELLLGMRLPACPAAYGQRGDAHQ